MRLVLIHKKEPAMLRPFRRFLLLPTLLAVFGVVALLATACGSSEPTDGDRLGIVVTTSILGDVVEQIVGGDAEVAVLMQPGQDPHSFQASAAQAAAMYDADLIVVSGLQLEEGLGAVIDIAADEGVPVLSLGEQLDPLLWGGDHHRPATDEESTDDEDASYDPHWWMDPLRMADAAEIIGEALGAADPDDADLWESRAAAYAEETRDTHDEIVTVLEGVAPERRRLVTNHNSLQYFADRYGFEVVGTVIPSGTTLASPSPADLAELVTALDGLGLDAIFAETTQPTQLADAVAAELAYDVEVVELYTGSLGPPDSGAEHYLSMMLTDAELIADALAD